MGAIDYIDVEKTAIRMLKDWYDQRWKLENAPKRVAEINDRMCSIKSTSSSSVPVMGGASRTEELLCNAIDQKTVALHGIKKAKEFENDISGCWARLTEDERFCLTARFIDYEDGDGIKKIMDRFHVERSEAYNRSKNALTRFARLLFW